MVVSTRREGEYFLDPMYKVAHSEVLDERTRKSIGLKIKNLTEAIASVEKESGVRYPEYYVEPVLTVVPAIENSIDGLAVLYARTIPVEIQGKVRILVQFSAPLILHATKRTLRMIAAHELLHYFELVKDFTTMHVFSQIPSSSVFEEQYMDSSRAIRPSLVFKNKRFAKTLTEKTSAGIDDAKLNEKCRARWIEKSLPTARISMGANQVNISAESVVKTEFDPKVIEIISTIRQTT